MAASLTHRSPETARYARKIARRAVGLLGRLDSIRRDIAGQRLIISILAAGGTPVGMYIASADEAEFRMDRAVTSLAALKRRYADALAELTVMRPLPFPKPAVAALACTFCGAPLEGASRCPGCGGPIEVTAPALAPLADDIARALSQNGYQTTDALAAHFGVSQRRVGIALDQIAGAGLKLHRDASGAEIDQAAEPVVAPKPTVIPIRAASTIAGIPVHVVPGQRGFFGVYRGSRMRTGLVARDVMAARLAVLGGQAGRVV